MTQDLVAQPKLLDHGTDALTLLDPLDRQFPELGRVGLFRSLHFLPSKSDINFRSPWADEISGGSSVTQISNFRPNG